MLLSNNDYKHHSWTWNTKLFSFDEFRVDFIVHGFFANNKLLTKYTNAVSVLTKSHCNPDGLLLKLHETGRKTRLKENICPPITRFKVEETSKEGSTVKFPVVDGGLEIVEIKCGRKARLMGKQKETYNNLIAKGYPLRMIKVRIVSFDLNQFLVEETKFERFL